MELYKLKRGGALAVTLIIILCLSFWYHSAPNKTMNFKIPTENPKIASQIQREVDEIVNQIESMITKVELLHKDNTTCAEKSKATIVNPKTSYCVGDNLVVQVDVFDYLGNRKTYGGDYLRARISTKELNAGASGKIEDFHNGTYHVHFTLYWEGKIDLSILLKHPSEAVSVLWNTRNSWYGYVDYSGKFTNQNQQTETKCGFDLNKSEELCEYNDERDEEYFYCMKPPSYECDMLTETKSWTSGRSKLTELEATLFDKSSLRVEIPKDFQPVIVTSCNNNTDRKKHEKCGIGMKLEYPSGHFMNNVWIPHACSMKSNHNLEELNACMQGKVIYILGDSTLRQWMLYFQSKLNDMTILNLYESGWAQKIWGIDLKRNMRVSWKRHANPFISSSYQSFREERTIPREIDLIGGHDKTVIVLNIGCHFRSYPVHHYIRRLVNIRRALVRLFRRSPETKVILKTENLSAISNSYEINSDFHGFVHYFVFKLIFKDLNVGFVNGWDMTNAFDAKEVHPPPEYIQNEIDLFMTYIC
ncbi:NXPE family member 4 isoform X2 [Xenopus laevis]|uniref:NXPE family member 4 isoform X2 n=1 Tax=Xenopus laevis TaxID=8355 RepID=A0A8J0TAV7_XENLA|nr:NXPE family member 4 isoform X2 [Xenopus laevis]XP_041425144.1 NXPE family member 4 isoform X2 [Xenopus laevis]